MISSRAREASNRVFSQRALNSLFMYSLLLWCICKPGGNVFVVLCSCNCSRLVCSLLSFILSA